MRKKMRIFLMFFATKKGPKKRGLRQSYICVYICIDMHTYLNMLIEVQLIKVKNAGEEGQKKGFRIAKHW